MFDVRGLMFDVNGNKTETRRRSYEVIRRFF